MRGALVEQMQRLDEAHFERLARPPEEVDAFRARLGAIAPSLGVRGAFAGTLTPLIERLAPEKLATYREIEAQFGRVGLFSWMPVRQLLWQAGHAAHLIWPGKPLFDAVDQLVERDAELIFAIPVIAPLLVAAEGRFALFAQTLAAAQNLIYDHGEMVFEQRGPREVSIYYDGLSATFLEAAGSGFWRGMMHMLDVDGEALFRRYDELHSESILRWSA